jgi:sulfonate transport system permease protein
VLLALWQVGGMVGLISSDVLPTPAAVARAGWTLARYLNTLHGVRSVDPGLIEMARAYGMHRLALIARVVLPGALPSIFVGLRYALGVTWLTLIVAETISATSGIGYMAMNAREFMLVDVVVFSILVYAVLGKLADSTARALERLCLSWNPAYRTR